MVPVLIPASPAKRSPSRQSSHESTEVVNPIFDDEPDAEGGVHENFFFKSYITKVLTHNYTHDINF
jgi:hypothetical protein